MQANHNDNHDLPNPNPNHKIDYLHYGDLCFVPKRKRSAHNVTVYCHVSNKHTHAHHQNNVLPTTACLAVYFVVHYIFFLDIKVMAHSL